MKEPPTQLSALAAARGTISDATDMHHWEVLGHSGGALGWLAHSERSGRTKFRSEAQHNRTLGDASLSLFPTPPQPWNKTEDGVMEQLRSLGKGGWRKP